VVVTPRAIPGARGKERHDEFRGDLTKTFNLLFQEIAIEQSKRLLLDIETPAQRPLVRQECRDVRREETSEASP
jgi:hypothetical protein